MKIKNALTIILPIYGRELHTRSFLKYLSYIKCPFKVLIADGGDKDQSQIINSDTFPNVDMTYIKYPYDKDIKTYMKKMADVYSRVTTPLTIMMDDDDLFCLNGMYEGVEFLSNNNDYAGYRQDVREIFFENGELNVEKSLYKPPSIDSDVALERVKESIVNRNALWHDITRTNVHAQFFNILSELEVNDLQLVVSLQCYYPPIFGKILRETKRPYYYHIPGSSLIQGTGILTRYVNWTKSETFDKSAAQAVSILGNALAHHTSADLKSSKKEFAETFFRNILETTCLETKEDIDVDKETQLYVKKYLKMSKEYDNKVQKCLLSNNSADPFKIDKRMSYAMTLGQSIGSIYDFVLIKHDEKDEHTIVLGDSHGRSFTYNKEFLSIFIGSGKEVNFMSDESAMETKRRLLNNLHRLDRNKNIMLVFGEPDVRLYLENHNEIRDLQGEKEYIAACTDRYMAVIKEVRKHISGNLIVYNAVPCPRLEQNLFSKKYNSRLKRLCKENQIPFVDIWNKVVDKDNNLDEKYSVDHIHLSHLITPIVIKNLKRKRLMSPTVQEEKNYSWSYLYKLDFHTEEARIWGDAAQNSQADKFERTERLRINLAILAKEKLAHLEAGSKILFLQCAEGFPAYFYPHANKYQIFGCDTEKDKILMARRLQSFTGAQHAAFAHYPIDILEAARWPEFDAAIYVCREEEEERKRILSVMERIPAKIKYMV